MKSLLSFTDLSLSRSEMKSIKGGCGVNLYHSGGHVEIRGMSKSDAKKLAASYASKGIGAGYWCCAHC